VRVYFSHDLIKGHFVSLLRNVTDRGRGQAYIDIPPFLKNNVSHKILSTILFQFLLLIINILFP